MKAKHRAGNVTGVRLARFEGPFCKLGNVGIHYGVGYVDTLWPQFTGHHLGKRPLAKLTDGQIKVPIPPDQR